MKTLKTKAVKFIGLQVALLLALVATQAVLQYAQTHRYVGFVDVKTQESWIGIAETAQADFISCNQQLEDMKKARDEANADIMK